jgi:hypothetical protein
MTMKSSDRDGREFGGTAMAGGAVSDISGAPAGSRPGYHEFEGRSGNHVTLPYSVPLQVMRLGQLPKVPQTTGVSAIVPYNYTIVDTKTLGSSSMARTRTSGRTQEP